MGIMPHVQPTGYGPTGIVMRAASHWVIGLRALSISGQSPLGHFTVIGTLHVEQMHACDTSVVRHQLFSTVLNTLQHMCMCISGLLIKLSQLSWR